jgi:NAD(P)-dependent dehydrogenase (short-subunit alcohol dehydrogenase family)
MKEVKWVLVTGAAKGLGVEICHQLAKKGFNIVVHYSSSPSEASKVVQECQELGVEAESIQGNFSSPEGLADFIRRYTKQYPKTCGLINNVGPYLIKPALETSEEEWQEMFQTNFFAPAALIRALMPSLKNEQGSIVNIGVAGLHTQRADIHSTAYSIAKMSLWMLTKSLAVEVAPFNVRVNMVSPGYLERSVSYPKNLSRLLYQRLGTSRELAEVVVFLLSISAQYITGQNLEIAGAVRL